MKLQQLHKTYAVEIFTGDVHGLPLYNDEARLKIVSWFRQYMK